MSKLSRDDVLKLARLSRLKLSDDEVLKFQTELSEILTYVEQLDRADVSGLTPTYQVSGLKNVTRPDEVADYGYDANALLRQAPALKDNQFKVRRVL